MEAQKAAMEVHKLGEAKKSIYRKLCSLKPTLSTDKKRMAAQSTPPIYHYVSSLSFSAKVTVANSLFFIIDCKLV